MKINHIIIYLIPLFLASSLLGQPPEKEYANISAIVFLDSFVVTAKKEGFDVDEFIEIVIEDQTFYQAFHNLRFISYKANNKIVFYDKKNRLTADYQSITKQQSDGRCRSMEVLEESVDGKFHKKSGQYRYYTAKMFDQIFFTKGKVCTERITNFSADTGENRSGIQKNIAELKKLMFQPGQKADVPLIGGKTAIFEPHMAPYYDYRLTTGKYQNKNCYVFSVKVKPEYQEKKTGKTVIKFMETFFEKGSLQVVARNYQLTYKGAAFSFDVNMEVELKKVKNEYYPVNIKYNGFWNIPGKKREKGMFSVDFYQFE